MPKSKDYAKGGNDRYMGMMKGKKGGGVMKNHGNTSSIATISPQKRDMGRLDVRPMEYRGYSEKAFAYKY